MTLFDLIFILVFFATVIMLVAAAVAALRGQGRRALSRLRKLGVFVAMYLAVVIATSVASSRRVIHLNERQCFDDWCISVDGVEHAQAGTDVSYTVAIRVSSRARRRVQRETGIRVYVLDDRGRRHEPEDDPDAVPFDVRLAPGESVIATRRFMVPADTHDPGLVIVHGRFPGMFIIRDDRSLFHKPSVVRFP